LARRDFSATLGKLESSPALGRIPRIAVVACDDAKDSSRAMAHLTQELRVPAVLGFASGKDFVEKLAAPLLAQQALTIVTMATIPNAMRVPQPQPRLFFRTTYSSAAAADPIARLVAEVIEPRVRRGAPANEPTRVAVLRVDTTSSDFSETLF